MDSIKLPAGRYYLGDPCYVIDGDKWNDFLAEFWKIPEDRGGVFEYDGQTCAAFYTMYGDGQYETTAGGYGFLPVDAGIIGCIPINIAGHADNSGGVAIEFRKPVECYEKDGWLHFGDIVVNTSDEEEEEDES
jgi:hypothetical protein